MDPSLYEHPCDLVVTSIIISSEDLLGGKYPEGSVRRELQSVPQQRVTPKCEKEP